jgi:type III restriction enzyme
MAGTISAAFSGKNSMAEQFLYEELSTLAKYEALGKEIPESLTRNISPRYALRPYQEDAFARFIHCYQKDFPGKKLPLHFLFNMATGSGKTLIMVGLMLYLYERGHRNFLFFVNSTNIIEKTRDNFLRPDSLKYLFHREITIAEKRVRVSPVENFEGASLDDLNICFTTIQKLHSDLTSEKENSLTYEDFKKHRVVLIADEAHHMSAGTRGQNELYESWENTVQRIFHSNEENLLLEFTATHDYENAGMVEKYRDKVLVRYDLLQFRNDLYSKDVVLVHSDFAPQERILQALILSQYKQAVAAKHNIRCKPVILFKAQKTIAQSKENKADFHALIDGLNAKQIAAIRQSKVEIVQRAFAFFDENKISDAQLAERLQRDFGEDFCLSVNEESEKEKYQILLNTLEAPENKIRAIFAVKKLDEGWDVLNLFDIVRCYEARDTGRTKTGSTTSSEAQLIGRGARYFPFVLSEHEEKYQRKFDGDLKNELRVLEELHYHSVNDNRYISEIRAALIAEGMMDETVVERELKLKEPFKQTDFYKLGVVWLNDRVAKSYSGVHSLCDMGVSRRNFVHVITGGSGGSTVALDTKAKTSASASRETARELKLKEIDANIVRAALARNPFFHFDALLRYFPNLETMNEFIAGEKYLGGLAITFEGNVEKLSENRSAQLAGVQGLLGQIEAEIRGNATEYEGTRDFQSNRIHEIFTDKVLRFDQNNKRGEPFDLVATKDWFAFETAFATSEEKDLIRFLDLQIDGWKKRYAEIYLLRNESHFAIYNFEDGRAFQPDFVLFLREKTGELLSYQLFIEPKGKHLKEHDQWKEEFLQAISEECAGKTLQFDDRKYRLIGVPFYNNADENEFKVHLAAALKSASA